MYQARPAEGGTPYIWVLHSSSPLRPSFFRPSQILCKNIDKQLSILQRLSKDVGHEEKARIYV